MVADGDTDVGLSWCQPVQRMANAPSVSAASQSESCAGEGTGRGDYRGRSFGNDANESVRDEDLRADDDHAQPGEHNTGPECAERRFAGCHFLNQDSQKR